MKELNERVFIIKNLFETDVKLRIESLKTKHKIRNIIAYVFLEDENIQKYFNVI